MWIFKITVVRNGKVKNSMVLNEISQNELIPKNASSLFKTKETKVNNILSIINSLKLKTKNKLEPKKIHHKLQPNKFYHKLESTFCITSHKEIIIMVTK